MAGISLNAIARGALIPILVLVALGAAGCGTSFCAGSGCDSGKIFFGSNFKQTSKNGAISVVGKTSTFRQGQNVAMVANLSENAGTKTLTLEVANGGKHVSVPYHLTSSSSNELANLFNNADLHTLKITQPGTYTFRILRGSKVLASGSMTEK